MKNVFIFIVVLFAAIGCHRPYNTERQAQGPELQKGDTIRIANDELEYEVIIIEPGFYAWVNSVARPRGYYNQEYLEARNRFWVTEYNNRVLQPQRYDFNLYPQMVDYSPTINYGYEVNYMIFNYLVYFQITYNQRLGGFTARP